MDAKAVLFIDHREPKIRKRDFVLKHRMGAHKNINLA